MANEEKVEIGRENFTIPIPDQTEILTMSPAKKIMNPQEVIQKSLKHPLGTDPLSVIVQKKVQKNIHARATIVISDNTRPVPYRGEAGILWPVIATLLDHGIHKKNICILIANGTHRSLDNSDLKGMLDERIFTTGISIINHDYLDRRNLKYLGKTSRGTKININRLYTDADLKILTGLVESHFMAGVSGGRKSICPGLAGKETIYAFHSPKMLNNKNACDLQLPGNPCHEDALEISKMAGTDFMINVTLDKHYEVTGIYAGDLEQAHQQALEKLTKDVLIPIKKEYDIVITHAGFVGINHYQAAKAAVVAIPALKKGGYLVLFAHHTDKNPVGSTSYKSMMYLLKELGTKKFNQLILSDDWALLHDQWQVQMWSKVLDRIPAEHLIYYSPQCSRENYDFLPGVDGNQFLPDDLKYMNSIQNIPIFLKHCLEQVVKDRKNQDLPIDIAYLSDGPYGILRKM